jgi:predicted ABC-type sugar transport system permease subunit
MKDIVLIDGARTPFGTFGGALRDTSATDLGVVAAKAALERAGLDPKNVDQVIFGHGRQAGSGPNSGRQVAYRSGVPVDGARIAAYAISGLLCTGAGLFVAAQTGSGDPVIGTAFTLNSIAAAVLGGIGFLGGQGTMRGALAGSLLLSLMISVMFFLGFTPVAQYVAQGLIIIGAVAIPQFRKVQQ